MKYFIFVIPPNSGVENWHIHPINRREFAMTDNRNVTVHACDKPETADWAVDMLSRQNPGAKVIVAKPDKVGQIPLFTGEVSYTTITEKGMLPL